MGIMIGPALQQPRACLHQPLSDVGLELRHPLLCLLQRPPGDEEVLQRGHHFEDECIIRACQWFPPLLVHVNKAGKLKAQTEHARAAEEVEEV